MLKSKIFFISVFSWLILIQGSISFAIEEKFAVAVSPCPVLNSFDFRSVFGGADGKTLKVDENGFIREMEFVALAGTVFEIISTISKSGYSILEVKTESYHSKDSLYIDSRFVKFLKKRPHERKKVLLSAEKIVEALETMEASPYRWGGNYNEGIAHMEQFYTPSVALSPEDLSAWRLEGVDCSGLIYQASDGYTPRNTSWMVDFGQGLGISGLSAEEISKKVEPLDLIVLLGHVVIVLDARTAIESSSAKGGVIKSDLIDRLNEIMLTQYPMDEWDPSSKEGFVIRRWHDKK